MKRNTPDHIEPNSIVNKSRPPNDIMFAYLPPSKNLKTDWISIIPKDILKLIVDGFLDFFSREILRNVNKEFSELIPSTEWKNVDLRGFSFIGEAAYLGNKSLVKWFRDQNSGWECVMSSVAASGNLEMAKWVKEQGCEICEEFGDYIMSSAIYSGNFEMIKWLRDEGCKMGSESLLSAIENDNFVILQWLQENGCILDFNFLLTAMSYERLDMLNYCLKNMCHDEYRNYTNPEDLILRASRSKNPEIFLVWAHEIGIPWCSGVIANLASNRKLDMIKWARENGCNWGKNVHYEAIRGGYVEILVWIKANGYPVDLIHNDSQFHHGFDSYKNIETMRWVIENCASKWNPKVLTNALFNKDNFEIFDWATKNGCPWEDDIIFDTAIMRLKFLKNNNIIGNINIGELVDNDKKIRKYFEIIQKVLNNGHIPNTDSHNLLYTWVFYYKESNKINSVNDKMTK